MQIVPMSYIQYILKRANYIIIIIIIYINVMIPMKLTRIVTLVSSP